MNSDSKRLLMIVGFMAAGKSTAAARLGRELELEICDTDILIQARIGCSISEFFAKFTEAYFRKIENEVFTELINKSYGEYLLIATGGGLPFNEDNEQLLRTGSVIFLDPPWLELLERINVARQDRPVAAVLNDEQLHALWQERCKKYEAFADFIVGGYDDLKRCVRAILTPGEITNGSGIKEYRQIK